jgi:hypothetical protein
MPKATKRLALFATTLAALAGFGCEPPDASKAEAQQSAEVWVDQHAQGWSVNIQSSVPGLGFVPGPTSSPCASNMLWLRSETEQTEMNLFFDCPAGAAVDLAWMREHLRSYDVGFPRANVDAPGWRFEGYSSTTVIREGLTFESWDQGTLSLRVETPMYMLRGESQSPSCTQARMGADASEPEECLVTVPFTGPLVLTVEVPLSPDAFRVPPDLRTR